MPPCGLFFTANIAGPIGLVGMWPEEFPVCGCVENVAPAEAACATNSPRFEGKV